MSNNSPISPTNLFSRIETMKKWQMEHQQRLLNQQSQQTKFLTNEQRRMQEAFSETPNKSQSNTNNSDNEETVEEKSLINKINIDELPINSPIKDFNMLLEENLNKSSSPIKQEDVRPKRPFLKKGSGLGRFRMTLKDISSSHNSHKSRVQNEASKPKHKKQTILKSSEETLGHQEPKLKTQELILKTQDSKLKTQDPILKTQDPILKTQDPILKVQENVRKVPKQNEKFVEASVSSSYNSLLTELCNARQTDPELFNTPVINHSSEINQQLFERDLLDELNLFEALEQKVSNSSFCSNSSLVQRLMEHSDKSTPQKKFNFSNYKSDEESLASPKKTVYFSEKIEEETTDEESDISSDTNSINSDDVSDSPNKIYRETRDAATNTEYHEEISTDLLKTRLEELETEISTFRTENARVNKLRNQLEVETRNMEKQQKQLRKQLEEEKEQLKQQLNEEKTKIMKDKQLYDKYIRESREGRSLRQKDREELAAVRSHLSSVQEELKLKESKWGATHARLRNQVRQLEKEVTTLKIENTELRSKNGKLEATNKQLLARKPSDTKVLHEINKNLTKLAQENKPKMTQENKPKMTQENILKIAKVKSDTSLKNTYAEETNRNDENNRNSLNCSEASTTTQSFESIEREYEKMFGKPEKSENLFEKTNKAEVSYTADGCQKRREEIVLDDGSLQVSYPNGNVRTISANGKSVVMKYHNGDVKETCKDSGTVRYLYADAQVWHTTYPDGLELLEFSNGQIEKRFNDGSTEILFPNGCRRCTTPNGSEEVCFPDGTNLFTKSEGGEKILTLPNGQKEIHTVDHKRREYPDGTVKLLYPDGIQETRYANGRIRLKDKDGNLIMDSANV